jgi:aspartate racemase
LANGLIQAAHSLEAAGVDLIMIATNTMHLVFDRVASQVKVPMVSLLDAVIEEIHNKGFTRVGLLGSKTTMELPFYKDALAAQGIETLVPDQADRDYINRIIFEELSVGIHLPETRARYVAIIDQLARQGAQAVILGCTEIPMLVSENDTDIPLLDTTTIHARAVLEAAIRN